jgi:hypothetical protein
VFVNGGEGGRDVGRRKGPGRKGWLTHRLACLGAIGPLFLEPRAVEPSPQPPTMARAVDKLALGPHAVWIHLHPLALQETVDAKALGPPASVVHPRTKPVRLARGIESSGPRHTCQEDETKWFISLIKLGSLYFMLKISDFDQRET